jgi:predicted AAA+ superfamily ATPase
MQTTYWREGNKEVDFVVNIRDRLLAIEVKSGRRTRALSGLLAFRRQSPKAQTMVVGTGGNPTEEFLSRSAADWFRDIAALPSP